MSGIRRLGTGTWPLSLEFQLLSNNKQDTNHKGTMQARWRTNAPAVMDLSLSLSIYMYMYIYTYKRKNPIN